MSDAVAPAEAWQRNLVLHPTHPLFVQLKHPRCRGCNSEIKPGQPVDYTILEDGRTLWRHAGCGQVTGGAA